MATKVLAKKKAGDKKEGKKLSPEFKFVTGKLVGLQSETVSIDNIDADDKTFQFRIEVSTKKLYDDIRDNGIEFPLIVRNKKGSKKLQVICGFRRLTAAQELGMPEVPVIKVPKISDEEANELSVRENEQRKSYKDLDRANAIYKMAKAGKTVEDLKGIFKLQDRQIKRLKKLATLPDAIKKPVGEGKLDPTHALKLHELKAKFHKMKYDEWVNNVVEMGFSVRELDKEVRKRFTPKTAKRKPLYFRDKMQGTIKLTARVLKPEDMSDKDKKDTVEDLKKIIELLSA